MLVPLACAVLLALPASPLAAQEPDGSRPIGAVPPFHGEPAPPAWLRARSQEAAWVDTRHYIYEAYAGPDRQWLVRYVMLPDGNEAFREIEQAFLFQSEERRKPVLLKTTEVQVEPRAAKWKKLEFILVDRRDLLKP